jgi:hypothetical protein
MHDRIDTSRDDWQDQVAALVTSAPARSTSVRARRAGDFVMLAGEQTQQWQQLEKLDLYLGPERRTITNRMNVLVPLSPPPSCSRSERPSERQRRTSSSRPTARS